MKSKKNKQTNISDESPSEIQEYLKTKIDEGLTTEEVEKRKQLFGSNTIRKEKQVSFIVLFLKQISELMSLLLLVAGILSLSLSIYQQIQGIGENIALQYTQAAILLLIVFINALFGSIQEIKSNNAIEELEKMSSSNAKVIRDGIITLVDSSEVTIGDILIVEAGDNIQADGILLEVNNLQVIESILTGESNSISKNLDVVDESLPLGDQKNKIFSGTNVINGRGVAIVTSIGNNTEIGKVAKLISDKSKMKTPLQYKLHNLSKYLGIVGIVITVLTFFFSLFVIEGVIEIGFAAVQPSLILAISLAAAAIPEGLNAVVNIILSIGVKKMSHKNAIIKKLPAVETLGSTSVICSDKTGTLTMNKMTITHLWAYKNTYEEKQDLLKLSKEQIDLLKFAALCTDASIDENDSTEIPVGDPTELSILELAIKNKFSPIEWDKTFPRITTIPFDSDRKLMTSINRIDNQAYIIVKGAPDVLFSRCINIKKDDLNKVNNSWSDKSIRVLAVAIKKVNEKNLDINNLNTEVCESNLEFIGLIGMIDPPREEVKLAIKECINAGIKPVMITGDHLNTAIAIAKELGIISDLNVQKTITGSELSSLSDDYLKDHINDYSVYARVSPEDKLRIVRAWQENNQVVAMTGDGVNDAPALKAADIGCAMGITGTDVSKGAADMILTDDNFSTIIESVKSGRGIYESIRNIVKFLLSSNIAGIISIVLGMIIFYFTFEIGNWGYLSSGTFNGIAIDSDQANIINTNIKFQTTLTTIQILINNIVIETLPGVALGIQENTSSLMNRRPRSKYESIFADKLIVKIFVTGIINGLLTILAFTLGAYIAIESGVPMLRFFYGNIAAFISLTIGGILKSISMSSKISLFKTKWSENKWVYLACLISFSIILISTLVPTIASLFGERPIVSEQLLNKLNSLSKKDLETLLFNNTTEASMIDWKLFVIGISFGIIPLIILEIEKYFKNRFGEHKIVSNITTFEMIPKPPTFQEKYPIFKKFKKTKSTIHN